MLIFSKLVVGTCIGAGPPPPPVMTVVWVVRGGVRQYLVIFPQFTCQNTELNVMDVSIYCGATTATGLCSPVDIHNWPLSGSFTVGSILF